MMEDPSDNNADFVAGTSHNMEEIVIGCRGLIVAHYPALLCIGFQYRRAGRAFFSLIMQKVVLLGGCHINTLENNITVITIITVEYDRFLCYTGPTFSSSTDGRWVGVYTHVVQS